MSTNISLDIEACGEVVLSIGAVVFDPVTGDEAGALYHVLDPTPQIARGLKMDGGAFLWWLKQSEQARAAIHSGAIQEPCESFDALRLWWPDRAARTWCYPTSYDLPVLARAMAAFDAKPPWRWTETMCMRTLWKMACDRDPKAAEIEREASPDEHNALSDAKQQAKWCVRYLAVLAR